MMQLNLRTGPHQRRQLSILMMEKKTTRKPDLAKEGDRELTRQ
jgi:hypothetical protein